MACCLCNKLSAACDAVDVVVGGGSIGMYSVQVVAEMLTAASAAASSGEDEAAKAEAEIKVEVLTAMQASMAGN